MTPTYITAFSSRPFSGRTKLLKSSAEGRTSCRTAKNYDSSLVEPPNTSATSEFSALTKPVKTAKIYLSATDPIIILNKHDMDSSSYDYEELKTQRTVLVSRSNGAVAQVKVLPASLGRLNRSSDETLENQGSI